MSHIHLITAGKVIMAQRLENDMQNAAYEIIKLSDYLPESRSERIPVILRTFEFDNDGFRRACYCYADAAKGELIDNLRMRDYSCKETYPPLFDETDPNEHLKRLQLQEPHACHDISNSQTEAASVS